MVAGRCPPSPQLAALLAPSPPYTSPPPAGRAPPLVLPGEGVGMRGPLLPRPLQRRRVCCGDTARKGRAAGDRTASCANQSSRGGEPAGTRPPTGAAVPPLDATSFTIVGATAFPVRSPPPSLPPPSLPNARWGVDSARNRGRNGASMNGAAVKGASVNGSGAGDGDAGVAGTIC
eukprot:scaffold8952_cov96-Isochrysis_galbana.AAC.3